MSVLTTRPVCRVVQHLHCSVAVTKSHLGPFLHSHALVQRYLSTVVYSTSSIPSPNPEHTISTDNSGFGTRVLPGENIVTVDDVQDENTNTDRNNSLSFTSLKGQVNGNTLKALTHHPLHLEIMTPVQACVTALLPDLARSWDPEGIVPPRVPNPLPPHWKPPIVDWNAPRDILVRAKTGTGKTLAYIIPAVESRLNYVEYHANLAVINAGLENSPQIANSAGFAYRRRAVGPLILAPTRELAIQIANDAQQLTMHQRDFEVQLLVGGARKGGQIKDWLSSSRDLVVATPGRLRDLLTNQPEFRQGFKGCPMLILDEADTLLSMGFRDDIDAIASFLPRHPIRQTLLFSATMQRAVRQLASWILSPNHRFIDAASSGSDLTPNTERVASHDEELATHDHIEQFHTLCPTASDQLPTLLKLLAHDQLIHGSSSKVIVFCPTIPTTELFSMLLCSLAEGVLPDATTEILTMHSKMKQPARDSTRVSFRKAGKIRDKKPTILVTSDISARGVDYPRVTRVIQIGVPNKETMYVHRIGRMARGVDSFVTGKRKDDNRPVVRADMLLLPWEAGYMNWKLTSLPIKPLSISHLDDQLTSLSPQSSNLSTEFLQSALAEKRRRIDPANIRSIAASLLGYYLPLTPSLRLQPDGVVAGVSSWAAECFNVSIPTLARLPRKFVEAYEQSTQSKTKGLFVDGLVIAGASPLAKSKHKNHSVWEGAKVQKKPKRWY